MSHSDQDATFAAELFDLIWESLADVLGTAATATLVRRAIKRATSQISWSEPVVVVRNGLDYDYRLPATWKQPGNGEALGALRVVIDIGLPGIDGYEVGRRIRTALGSRVLLVALAADGQERRSSEAGFDAHLVKPVSAEDLTRVLGRAAGGDG